MASKHGCPFDTGTKATLEQDRLATCPVGHGAECELFRSVFTLHTLLMRVADRMTEPVGLTGSRWLLLSAVVWRDAPPTITELSQRCQLSVQNVSRMIASMEGEGLIERTQVPGEGRAQRVMLTPRGREVLEGTIELAHELRAGFLAGLTDDDVAALGERFTKLVENLRRMEQELSA